MIEWSGLEEAAPEVARLGLARLERGVALLGTLRADGSPRISPVEPHFVEGRLVFGAMSWSGKARDLLRDPRCALHSAVCDPDNPEGELKLYGRADEIHEADVREARREAWWVGRPREDARVFSLRIEEAAYITWDADRGVMTLRRWTAEVGFSETRRPYP